MTKRIGRLVSFGGALLLGAAGFLFAHDPEKKSSMDGMMKGCQEHHAGAMKASDEANTHLAEAKRAATMADMRKHVELAEKAMAEMKKLMSLCMGMMDKMHGGMTSGGMMGGGMMGGGMMSGEKKTAAKMTDPVCNMAVDTASAPSAMYKGKTYYFCSEEDKQKFEKNPEQYAGKKS